MEDIEIYDLATSIISTITNDINESCYEPLNGKLSISWNTDATFNAWAQSLSKPEEPPIHKVGMYYELARQLYRDIDEYCEYIEAGVDQSVFDFWFKDDPEYGGLLPSEFSKENYRKNMFISALTWVFFHEIGHLNQEHGFVRNKLHSQKDQSIHECHIDTYEKLCSKKSAIYHATEMAADYEATSKTVMELIRHFTGQELESAVNLFTCSLSCLLYRFNGTKSFIPTSKPIGSHPSPLIRLGNVMPQIYELIDWPALREHTNISLDRRELVCMCSRASITAGLFWLRRHAQEPGIPDDYFVGGVLDKPGIKEYMAEIMKVWDEIEPDIKNNKRYGHPLEILQFTEEYRNMVLTGPEVAIETDKVNA